MNLLLRLLLIASALGMLTPPARAQDLYDTTTLRTFALTFPNNPTNFVAQLRANYASETDLLADLVVDGVTYPGVGVRIRGNTSYTGLPANSEKFSLKIEMGFTNPDQNLYGYETINLNNGFLDPTFSREVTYNNFVGLFIPNIRANNALITLNGQNWGVYNNIQQGNKSMLRRYFPNPDGVRITCSNNPNGPGLAYNANPASYSVYEVNNFGSYADEAAAITNALIPVTELLSATTAENWPATDARFAIDPSIWSVVLENMLTDDDSYVNKGCDFATYTDPLDNRMHLIQRDANETFKLNWSPTVNFSATNKPLLSRVISMVPEMKQRYFSHYRAAMSRLNWTYFGPLFTANRTLLDAAVQADPKRLYSYQDFQNGFGTTSVTLHTNSGGTAPGGSMAYGSIVGLQQFFTQRNNTLIGTAELISPAPAVSTLQASSDAPTAGDPVIITSTVAPSAGTTIAKVELFYRTSASTTYQRVAMLDDGASGDGGAGDGVYVVSLPVVGTAGQIISYYVGATSSNSFGSMTFLPELSERGPRTLEYQLTATPGMRLTEWMYSGLGGEFMEFTNLSSQPIDLTGWSIDDSNAVAGTFSLTPFGVVQPGESVVVTETADATFRTAWGLAGTVKVIGNYGVVGFPGNGLGRSDQINLYNSAGALIDRLSYGDQIYVGSPRTQNASGQAGCAVIGQNNALGWQLSVVGDAYGSLASTSADVGTPGRFPFGTCATVLDNLFANGFDSTP